MPYQSQSESELDRSIGRLMKLRKKLGASDNLFDPVLSKPKGMHGNTFRKLEQSLAEETFCGFLPVIKKKLGL